MKLAAAAEIHFAQIGDAAVDLPPQHIQRHAVADLEAGTFCNFLVQRNQCFAAVIGRPPIAAGDHGAGRGRRRISDAAVTREGPFHIGVTLACADGTPFKDVIRPRIIGVRL